MSDGQPAAYNGDMISAYFAGEIPLSLEVLFELFRALDHRITEEAQHRILADDKTYKRIMGIFTNESVGGLPAQVAALNATVNKLAAEDRSIRLAEDKRAKAVASRVRRIILALDRALDLQSIDPDLATIADYYKSQSKQPEITGPLPPPPTAIAANALAERRRKREAAGRPPTAADLGFSED